MADLTFGGHNNLLCNLLVVCRRVRSSLEGNMELEYFLGLITSFLIMGYLIYALLYPEKF
jgi:K+-transporting ATPase KdpF subunit